jgi:hypothetical protein
LNSIFLEIWKNSSCRVHKANSFQSLRRIPLQVRFPSYIPILLLSTADSNTFRRLALHPTSGIKWGNYSNYSTRGKL